MVAPHTDVLLFVAIAKQEVVQVRDEYLHLLLWLGNAHPFSLQRFLNVRVVHKLGDLRNAGRAVVLRALHHLAPCALDAASNRERRHWLARDQLRRLVAVKRPILLVLLEDVKVGVDGERHPGAW